MKHTHVATPRLIGSAHSCGPKFAKQLDAPIGLAAVNAEEPSVFLRAIEGWLKANQLKSGTFGHLPPRAPILRERGGALAEGFRLV